MNITKTNASASTWNDVDLSGDLSVGDIITYTYSVENTGTAALTGVTVEDDLLGTVTLSDDALDGVGFLAAGDTESGTLTYTLVAGDEGRLITNIATADSVQTGPDTDTNSVTPPTPSLNITKTVVSITNPDLSDGGSIVDQVGDKITYGIVVTNNGTANLTNVTVDDNLTGTVDAPCATFLAGGQDPQASCTVTVMYTVTQLDIDNNGNPTRNGFIDNTGTGDSVQTDPASDSKQVPVEQNPLISIVKTFAEDAVIAGGAGSSFTMVVTNDGKVTLSDALIEDTVDSRLTVTGVSGTSGADADTDTDAQTVEWLISSLALGASATITVNFTVASDVEEADGEGGVNDADNVPNTATVAAEAPQGNPGDPDDDITATDDDSIDIQVDIDLSIVKAFDPAVVQVPQGTGQLFTIRVDNAGPSDAVGVLIEDTVNGFLDISDLGAVVVTHGDGTCTWDMTAPPPLAASDIECTVDIPVGDYVEITVHYLVAPFLSGPPIYGDPTSNGSEFRFVFANGSILEGKALGPVYLDGEQLDLSGQTLTKNDFFFDPPGGDPGFLMHLSCSDPFTDGWGQSAGPVEGVDVNWQIDYFTIARYKQGGQFFRNCGNVIAPFDVPNQAFATGTDTVDGEVTVESNIATVTIKEGIRLDKIQKKAKHASVDLTNFTGDPKEITYVEFTWPEANQDVRQIKLGGVVIWTGRATGIVGTTPGTRTVTIGDYPSEFPGDLPGDYDSTPWVGSELDRTLGPVITEKLQVFFTKKASNGSYGFRLNFADGTFLDISI